MTQGELKSKYGWSCGQKLKDNKVNGSIIKPRFNLRVIAQKNNNI